MDIVVALRWGEAPVDGESRRESDGAPLWRPPRRKAGRNSEPPPITVRPRTVFGGRVRAAPRAD